MAASAQDIIAGRKTFFITPDETIFPESFCEDFLAHGYECYFIKNDKKISLEQKIEILISVFKDVILFFNLDAEIPGMGWPRLIRRLREKHGDQFLMGALFLKRQSKDEKAFIEYKYLYDLGLNCGCIQLEYQKKLNYGIIEKVLFANQAMGRRKSVRAIGNNGTTFGFTYNKENINGILQDISLSHFSFISPEGTLELSNYERIEDIQFNIKGFHFRSSAVLVMRRILENGDALCVFMFTTAKGGAGLDILTQQNLLPRLYELMNDNCLNLLERLCESYVMTVEKKNEISDLEEVEDDLEFL